MVSGDQNSVCRRRDLTLGVAIVFVMLWALLTHTHIDSWNEFSRLAAVEALVERGTWIIDETALGSHTGDKVLLNGHYYSDKPPLLTFAASGVYAVLHVGLGLTFDSTECDPNAATCFCFAFQCPRPFDLAYYIITLVLVGLPSALMLALFYRGTARFSLSNFWALLLTGILGLGTLILPFSLVFNNHIPTAACLLIGLYALMRARDADTLPERWMFVSGLFTALATALEFNVAPFGIMWLALAAWRHRRRVWPFVIGGLLPVLATLALDWWMLGDLWPPQLHPSGYNYPGSMLYTTPGGTHGSPDVLAYSFRMLIGDHGVLAYTPVLLWCIAALGMAIRPRRAERAEAGTVALASLIVTLYVLFTTDNFGGEAYGPRWFIAITPLLFVYAARPSLYSTAGRKLTFAALSLLSVYAAYQGADAPWHSALPPLRLETSASAAQWYQPLSRTESVARVVQPLDATSERFLEQSVGHTLSSPVLCPGDTFTVTWHWLALTPSAQLEASLLAHLINGAGALADQSDNCSASAGN
jgi:hypothetical protein